MLKAIVARMKEKYRTTDWPAVEASMPDRFRGRPAIDSSKCSDGCARCVDACPTGALRRDGGRLSVDLGSCLFCADCEAAACPSGALSFTADYALAARTREGLVVSDGQAVLASALDEKMRRLFGRSLKLRQVSAAGCNACEADVNVLSTIGFDLGRFGIQVVASPRHADGLLVTGPVSANMRLALEKTYDAVPSPKIVIASGACAISGGPYSGHAQVHNGCASTLPVDLFIPGCPPHPLAILDGLLRLLGRLEGRPPRAATAPAR
jgi:Ni,Fe-hydrogenase III small subunit/ferredoxin